MHNVSIHGSFCELKQLHKTCIFQSVNIHIHLSGSLDETTLTS